MIDIQGLYDSVKCEYPLPLPDDVDKKEMPDTCLSAFPF